MRNGSCVRVVLACLALAACSDDEEPGPIDHLDSGIPDSGQLDAKAPDATVDGDASMAACSVDQKYSFHRDGGLVFQELSYEVSGTTFRSFRSTGDAGTESCSIGIGSCGAPSVDAADLNQAFKNSDVLAAFSANSSAVLGVDPRVFDGDVLIVERADGKKIIIGSPCGTTAGCTAIPAGVEALRTMLLKMVQEHVQQAPLDGGPAPFCPTR